MVHSKHYCSKGKQKRRDNIALLGGIGKVVWEKVIFNTERGKAFTYKVTDKAILQIFDAMGVVMVTQFPAKPERILCYWKDAPQKILDKAETHRQNGLLD